MTALYGEIGLSLAVLLAAAAMVSAVASGKLGSTGLLRTAKVLIVAVAGLLSVASAALVVALLNSEFTLPYVARYTERALPFGYKLAAFWAGQEGSLLLWAWVLAVMAVVFVVVPRRVGGLVESAGAVATVAVTLLFFSALMLFAANPFKVTSIAPADGAGLNPMLQDPAMIAHPPLLFMGYAAYAFPFAMLIGALVAGRRDAEWLTALRPWAIVSWLFLSIGILLGAQWAYVELGWGGYWAWDPVENASLLPWLTGTALLHSIMVQQHRGMFRKWNAFLIAITFVLCVFGSYLTRSGIVQSVHAFEASLIGTFFLGFLLFLTVGSLGLIVARRKLLRSEQALEGLMGREGLFLATNVLLVGMTLVTLIGTILPVITRAFGGSEMTVGPSFYNRVVAPMGLLLVALMALGPMLTYGPTAAAKLARASVVPAILAAVTVLVMLLGFGQRNPWALGCGAIVAVALSAATIDFVKAWRHRMRAGGENAVVALARLFDSSHRRYGGQIVHVGVLMIAVGVIGSSLFSQNETKQLKPGETATVAGREITFVELRETRAANFTAVEAVVKVADRNGKVDTVRPQRRFYDKSEQPNAEVSIDSSWREDVYVNLAGWEAGGAITAVQVIVNPLVSLMWTGGIVLTVGGLICLLPRLLPHARHAAEAADDRSDEAPAGARAATHAAALHGGPNGNGRRHEYARRGRRQRLPV